MLMLVTFCRYVVVNQNNEFHGNPSRVVEKFKSGLTNQPTERQIYSQIYTTIPRDVAWLKSKVF